MAGTLKSLRAEMLLTYIWSNRARFDTSVSEHRNRQQCVLCWKDRECRAVWRRQIKTIRCHQHGVGSIWRWWTARHCPYGVRSWNRSALYQPRKTAVSRMLWKIVFVVLARMCCKCKAVRDDSLSLCTFSNMCLLH